MKAHQLHKQEQRSDQLSQPDTRRLLSVGRAKGGAGRVERQESGPDAGVEVPINCILPADSPRSAGSSSAHVRRLLEADAELPAILVHRPTMRVIDGMHRLTAAKIRGSRTIKVRFFDGDEDEAFVLAVESNIKHGLPLSLADRKAAALRIIKAHPQWSDRAVAAKTGLAHKTVGAIRRRSSGEVPQLPARVGQDGRVRPVRTNRARQRVSESDRRDANLGGHLPEADSESLATAYGDPLVIASQPAPCRASSKTDVPAGKTGYGGSRADGDAHWKAALQRLRSDPALRYTQAGRIVLRILDLHVASGELRQVSQTLPEHCLGMVAALARRCAEDCHQLSVWVEERRGEGR